MEETADPSASTPNDTVPRLRRSDPCWTDPSPFRAWADVWQSALRAVDSVAILAGVISPSTCRAKFLLFGRQRGAGFHARSVARIPGLKSETWGTLRLLPEGRGLRKGTAKVPPLRFASVGMTRRGLRSTWAFAVRDGLADAAASYFTLSNDTVVG